MNDRSENNLKHLLKFLEQLTLHEYYERLIAFIQAQQPRPPIYYHLLLLPAIIPSVRQLDLTHYYYTPELEVFANCLHTHALTHDLALFSHLCKHPKSFHNTTEIQLLLNFLNDLHLRLNARELKTLIQNHQKQSNRNYRNMCHYVDRLFDAHARIVALRIDLSYSHQNVSLDRFEQDLHHLHQNVRHKQLFDHLLGYIIKIEHGLNKGVHAHVLLFFDGSKRDGSADIYLTQKIGEYWKNEITQGEGFYWNVNENKAHYERQGMLGIGEIHYSQTDLINNLKSLLAYFCKRQQYIKPKSPFKFRLLRRGDMPVMRDKKLGRPRKCESDNCDNGG